MIYLDVGALKLSDERAVALEDGDVEAVAVTVANQDVAGVADVNAVGVVGDVLTADTMQELTVLTKHHHAVTLTESRVHLHKALYRSEMCKINHGRRKGPKVGRGGRVDSGGSASQHICIKLYNVQN